MLRFKHQEFADAMSWDDFSQPDKLYLLVIYKIDELNAPFVIPGDNSS
jgi:hypothetical protein